MFLHGPIPLLKAARLRSAPDATLFETILFTLRYLGSSSMTLPPEDRKRCTFSKIEYPAASVKELSPTTGTYLQREIPNTVRPGALGQRCTNSAAVRWEPEHTTDEQLVYSLEQ